MRIIYLISIIFLIITFLRYKKNDKELSLTTWIVYSLGLIFCYNIVIVFILSYIGITSSLLVLSIVSILVGSSLLFLSLKRKEQQKYYFSKKELISLVLIIIISFLGYVRTDGLTSIAYETTDSALHYKAAKYFSNNMMLLTKSNSTDSVYSFSHMMNISYINGGLTINLLSFMKSYFAFILFDIFSLILCACLFFVTIINLIKMPSKKYLYSFIITILYILALPLNSYVFGFCYLGLGIMVINLLILTIYNFNNDLLNNKIFKLIVLTMLTFGVFNSYYLFMPSVYLTLGIYYIYNYLKLKISMKELLLYGVITLIIPFIVGVFQYNVFRFVDNPEINVLTIGGYIYYKPIYFLIFIYTTILYIFSKKQKNIYLNISYYVLAFYIIIFTILKIFGHCAEYYYAKLFYYYFLLFFIVVAINLVNYKKIIYSFFIVLLVSLLVSYYSNNNHLVYDLSNYSVYNWNFTVLRNEYNVYQKEDLALLEKAKTINKECLYRDELLLIGNINSNKNMWYYAITDLIPVPEHINKLHTGNINLDTFNNDYKNHRCTVYLYNNNVDNKEIIKDYDIVFKNSNGAILKKKEK